MYLIPFMEIFREQAMSETRTLTTPGSPDLPADSYALVESYCPDPQCDCRRVMLNVIADRQGHVATISFGFDRDEEMAGPFLDPLNKQSRYSGVLLSLVTTVALADPAYVARLERHYRQVKEAVANPSPDVRQALAKYGVEKEPKTWRRKSRRNKPNRRKK
ncbi:MAG: hypothetical protein JMDDDDMK_03991 [Acidobacteria bacterium]|nr:hypothetical protein [Acidobacteriota bacterium]